MDEKERTTWVRPGKEGKIGLVWVHWSARCQTEDIFGKQSKEGHNRGQQSVKRGDEGSLAV